MKNKLAIVLCCIFSIILIVFSLLNSLTFDLTYIPVFFSLMYLCNLMILVHYDKGFYSSSDTKHHNIPVYYLTIMNLFALLFSYLNFFSELPFLNFILYCVLYLINLGYLIFWYVYYRNYLNAQKKWNSLANYFLINMLFVITINSFIINQLPDTVSLIPYLLPTHGLFFILLINEISPYFIVFSLLYLIPLLLLVKHRLKQMKNVA